MSSPLTRLIFFGGGSLNTVDFLYRPSAVLRGVRTHTCVREWLRACVRVCMLV